MHICKNGPFTGDRFRRLDVKLEGLFFCAFCASIERTSPTLPPPETMRLPETDFRFLDAALLGHQKGCIGFIVFSGDGFSYRADSDTFDIYF